MRFARALFALFGCLLTLSALLPARATAGPTVLFNPDDGRIFYAEQPDDQWHPASLTKIMTAYLVFEALRTGRIKFDAKVPVSENAHKQPPSKLGLPIGAEMPLEVAIKALIVKSANDVAIMLAEKISGSEQAFVDQMNAKARQLSMTRTWYVNPNGLPAAGQVTTARDLAILSSAITKDFPEHAHYWGLPRMKLGKIRLASHNSLLKSFEGANGLKTGFICDSGFNIVASAARNGRRLMAVVLGEPTATERSQRAAALLEHGFETFGWKYYFSNSSIHSRPDLTSAKPVHSIRSKVRVGVCGWRRKPVARTANVAKTTGGGTRKTKKVRRTRNPKSKTARKPRRAKARAATKKPRAVSEKKAALANGRAKPAAGGRSSEKVSKRKLSSGTQP